MKNNATYNLRSMMAAVPLINQLVGIAPVESEFVQNSYWCLKYDIKRLPMKTNDQIFYLDDFLTLKLPPFVEEVQSVCIDQHVEFEDKHSTLSGQPLDYSFYKEEDSHLITIDEKHEEFLATSGDIKQIPIRVVWSGIAVNKEDGYPMVPEKTLKALAYNHAIAVMRKKAYKGVLSAQAVYEDLQAQWPGVLSQAKEYDTITENGKEQLKNAAASASIGSFNSARRMGRVRPKSRYR